MTKSSALVALAAIFVPLSAFGQAPALPPPPADANAFAVIIHEGRSCSFAPDAPAIIRLAGQLAARGYTVSKPDDEVPPDGNVGVTYFDEGAKPTADDVLLVVKANGFLQGLTARLLRETNAPKRLVVWLCEK
jgi:hypothetical protein